MSEDHQAIAKPDEIEDVDKTPAEPGDKAGELDLAKCANRFGFPNRRHGPFIEIMERGALFFGEPFAEDLGDIAPLLHSDRSQAGKGFPFFIHGTGCISKDEDLRVVGDGEIGFDEDTPLPVHRDVERF